MSQPKYWQMTLSYHQDYYNDCADTICHACISLSIGNEPVLEFANRLSYDYPSILIGNIRCPVCKGLWFGHLGYLKIPAQIEELE